MDRAAALNLGFDQFTFASNRRSMRSGTIPASTGSRATHEHRLEYRLSAQAARRSLKEVCAIRIAGKTVPADLHRSPHTLSRDRQRCIRAARPNARAGKFTACLLQPPSGDVSAARVGRWSTKIIGRFYNGRDHSTVCHDIQRIEALSESDPEVDALLSDLKRRLAKPFDSHVAEIKLGQTRSS